MAEPIRITIEETKVRGVTMWMASVEGAHEGDRFNGFSGAIYPSLAEVLLALARGLDPETSRWLSVVHLGPTTK